MSDVKKFKFVSPGIFIDEIDKSKIPGSGLDIGPVVIGRSQRGPFMRPVRVESFAEFVELFGAPVPGAAADGDPWRNGSLQAPTYAAYAAQAWLKNNSPLTFVRIAGDQHSKATTTGYAGWAPTATAPNVTVDDNGGAYGLFLTDQYGWRHASASFNMSQNLGMDDDLAQIALTSSDGTARSYLFKAGATNGAVHEAGGTAINYVHVDRSPAGNTPTTRANALAAAINSANGHQGKITAAANKPNTGDVTIFQDVAGDNGNTSILHSNLAADDITFMPKAGAAASIHDQTGLFMAGGSNRQGTLAAVWYLNKGQTIRLSGALAQADVTNFGTTEAAIRAYYTASVGQLIRSEGDKTFTVLLGGNTKPNHAKDKKYEFTFNRDSAKFIRRVFNTNPGSTNSTITNTAENYWLGETFEGAVARNVTGSSAGSVYGYLAALTDGSTRHADHRFGQQASRTGWFFSQDVRSGYSGFTPSGTQYVQNLFRFESLDDGDWAQNNLKISITDLRAPQHNYEKYGSFTVLIRRIEDIDNAPKVVERYSGLNLNPDSENFISRRIGDKFLRWDDTLRRYKEEGNYDNVSRFIRVIMNVDVEANGPKDPQMLPFGVRGPIRYKTVYATSGSTDFSTTKPYSDGGEITGLGAEDTNSFLEVAVGQVPYKGTRLTVAGAAGVLATRVLGESSRNMWTGSFEFPIVPLRKSALSGALVNPTDAFFGADTTRLGEPNSVNKFDESVIEVLRPLPTGARSDAWTPSADPDSASGNTVWSWHFTLDDLSGSHPTGEAANHAVAVYASGSRNAGKSYTASGSKGYRDVLDMGYNKFTSPFFGGATGYDITEREPFRNTRLDDQNRNEKLNYAYYSVKKAVDVCADQESLEYDVMVTPGVWDTTITDHMINVCESRGDALAIIDLPEDYTSEHEGKATVQNRIGTVNAAVASLKGRGLNSSYGCAFYPWVQVRDTASDSGAGQLVWVPPSVAALGTFSSTQKDAELWFAPAGFNRGGLTEGSAGLSVVNVRQKLTAKERDKLYEANINPIASFPSEGIVVFGQKTLQVTKSALDRINVRRLMIYIKKQVSRFASQILFEQNVQATWDRFASRVVPFLESIKTRFGLSDFKLVLDETTTTDDLIDQNILYAKIFLKPTRTIEFIALDFVITSTGASFED